MSFRLASPRLQRKLLPLVLLALVMAQTLGALHRVVHSPLAVPSLAAKAAPHGLATLFAGHTTEQGCDAYDQLSHADVLPGVAPVLAPPVPVEAIVVRHVASHIAGTRAGFRARGPPATA